MLTLKKPSILNVKSTVRLPLSKSVSNRQVILSKLIGVKIDSNKLSQAEDTTILNELINSEIETLNCGLAGTTFRFLLAYLAIQPNKHKILTGDARMLERPIGYLVDALITLGADIEYLGKDNFPPLRIHGKVLEGGEVEVDASISSQFISALMLIAPGLKRGLKIKLKGQSVSNSYIELTGRVMRENGIRIRMQKDEIIIDNQDYKSTNPSIARDWSSAIYWYQIAALSNSANLFLEGLEIKSNQGDERVISIFKNFGVESKMERQGIAVTKKNQKVPESLELNCSSCPDLVPSIVVTCAALGVDLKISGIGHLVYKESNRILALKEELAKLNVQVDMKSDVLHVSGTIDYLNSVKFMLNTHNDHRIAMAFAPLMLTLDELLIDNPIVVNKSYPGFWEELNQILN